MTPRPTHGRDAGAARRRAARGHRRRSCATRLGDGARRHAWSSPATTCGCASAPRRGARAGSALRDVLGCDYFCFLSAHRLAAVSPYGTRRGRPHRAAARARAPRSSRATPAATPASRCSPGVTDIDRARRRHDQGRRARRRRRSSRAGSTVYAGANWHERETPRDVRHRLRRPPRPAQHVPARPTSRATRCARTSRCWPAWSSRGRASSTSSRCPRPTTSRRRTRKRSE